MITMPVWLLLLLFTAAGATGAAIAALSRASRTLDRILTDTQINPQKAADQGDSREG